jgi:hypothetical protein
MTAKPVKAGDVIVWTHYSADQEPAERTGTVWSGAPTGNGLSNAWWVHPDDPQPGELLAGGVLAVGRASRRNWQTGSPDKGEVYGSSRWQDQPGSLTQGAASAMRNWSLAA